MPLGGPARPADLVLPAHLPLDELARRYRTAHDPVAHSHWQIIWLLSSGHRTRAVAAVTGYSVNWVRAIATRYRRAGPAGLGDRRHQHPGGPALLDAAGQAELQMALAGPAPGGELWTGRQVAPRDHLGRAVSKVKKHRTARLVSRAPAYDAGVRPRSRSPGMASVMPLELRSRLDCDRQTRAER